MSVICVTAQNEPRDMLKTTVGGGWSLPTQQEADVERQQPEINEPELTAEELDSISGGLRNNQTEAWGWFQLGMERGFVRAYGPGGGASCGLSWPS